MHVAASCTVCADAMKNIVLLLCCSGALHQSFTSINKLAIVAALGQHLPKMNATKRQ